MTIGDVDDPRCKQSDYKPITSNTCRNNCKHFKYDPKIKKRICLLGYRHIKTK